MIKYLAALLLVLAAVAWRTDWIPFASWGGQSEKPAPATKVVRASIKPVLPLSGQVTPAFQVEVKPEIGGKIAEIHVEPGQKVQKGDPLVTIDDTDLRNERAGVDAEIEGARLTVERIRGNYERAQHLFSRKLLSEEEFVNLEADLRISENDLERSIRRRQLVDDRIAKTRILAPFDGTILQILVNEGQVVVGAASINSGTSLMTFADLSRLLINTHVNQLDANKLFPGQHMIVNPPESTESAADAEAVVSFIAPLATVKNNIKGFEVKGELDGTPQGLKPGVSVSMAVPLGSAEGVLAVPVTAVFDERGSKIAYVRKEEGPERREVAIGLSDLAMVEIQSGLTEGEEVLLAKPESTEKTANP